MIVYVGYYVIKKNSLMKQGELVTTEPLHTDLSASDKKVTTELPVPDGPVEVKLVHTIVAPNDTIKNFRLFPSGNTAYIKINSLFYNDELILEIGENYTIGAIEEIGGKIMYELSYKSGESWTLFYDKRSVVPVGYTYLPLRFKDIGGKLAYTLIDDKTHSNILYYDNKKVADGVYNFFDFEGKMLYTTSNGYKLFYNGNKLADDALPEIRTGKMGPIYRTSNVSKSVRTETLFYNTEKIAEAEMFYDYYEIDGKIAYTAVTSIDYYNDVSSLYYDGKKIGDDLNLLPEAKNKLAYQSYDKSAKKINLFYDGKKINSYSEKYFDIDNIKEIKGKLHYTVSGENQTSIIFSNDKKIAEVDYHDRSFFVIGDKICYFVFVYNKSGIGTRDLFCDGEKIRSDISSEFGEARGRLTYITYNQVSKKYSLFYNDKEMITADEVSRLVYDEKSTSSPIYFRATDKKDGSSMYSIYRIQ